MISSRCYSIVLCAIIFINTSLRVSAQIQSNGSQANNIITAVPFLLITPDARAGSMGNAGVAVDGDANSSSINVSKLAYLENRSGFALSYSPWLKNLASDVNLAYLSGYYKLDDRNTLGSAFRFFSMGNISILDESQQDLGIFSPREFAFDISFSRSFGEDFALGTTLRYINSNLGGYQLGANQQSKPGQAVAADISGIFRKETQLFNKDAVLSFGANISNIGTKMSYSDGSANYFLPTNLKIGGASKFALDAYSELTFALDLNKLLAPTQPIYDIDGTTIIRGKNPERSVPGAIFGSFSDAPGGFSEEMKEVGISSGIEYTYNKLFALRGGYNYENPVKGNSRYFTLGAGFKYNIMNIDFSYLIASSQNSPLANTLRFSLLFNFGKKDNYRDPFVR